MTSPMIFAEGAMKVVEGEEMVGVMPLTETIRDEGTRRSVYFATSKLAPILSMDLLLSLCKEYVEIIVKDGEEWNARV